MDMPLGEKAPPRAAFSSSQRSTGNSASFSRMRATGKQPLRSAPTAPPAPSHAPIRKKAPNILGRMFVKKKRPFTRRSHRLDTALIIHHLRSEAYHPPFSALAAGIASRVRIRQRILRRKRGVRIGSALGLHHPSIRSALSASRRRRAASSRTGHPFRAPIWKKAPSSQK